MLDKKEILKRRVLLSNYEISSYDVNKPRKLMKTIILSGTISLILLLIIIFTLPLTGLTVNSLFVFSSIVSLIIFLFVLLFRYFSTLFMAYFFITRYSVKEKNSYSPFVSIIVPVFNEGVILKDSIKSLLNLDYVNYEMIILKRLRNHL
jgi:hypothetical protein